LGAVGLRQTRSGQPLGEVLLVWVLVVVVGELD
jgi:hypothetical protein